jgi:hypothetical protein
MGTIVMLQDDIMLKIMKINMHILLVMVLQPLSAQMLIPLIGMVMLDFLEMYMLMKIKN